MGAKTVTLIEKGRLSPPVSPGALNPSQEEDDVEVVGLFLAERAGERERLAQSVEVVVDLRFAQPGSENLGDSASTVA